MSIRVKRKLNSTRKKKLDTPTAAPPKNPTSKLIAIVLFVFIRSFLSYNFSFGDWKFIVPYLGCEFIILSVINCHFSNR